MRFWNTRRSAGSSPRTGGSASGRSYSTCMPAASISARDDSTMSFNIGGIATGLSANPRCPDWMPANSRICSTISVSRRPSFRTRSPYFRICSSSRTTPSARLSPADRITASGVRSSCDTAATNSICWRASSCARRVERISRPTLAPSTARMLELMRRFRRRPAFTAPSSDPDGCVTTSRQRGALEAVVRDASAALSVRPTMIDMGPDSGPPAPSVPRWPPGLGGR